MGFRLAESVLRHDETATRAGFFKHLTVNRSAVEEAIDAQGFHGLGRLQKAGFYFRRSVRSVDGPILRDHLRSLP